MKQSICIVLAFVCCVIAQEQPYYLDRCSRNDPEVNDCLRNSINRLSKYLRQGVHELEVEEVEPVLIDEISIALGSGPDGYRAMFKNVEAYGVSNSTVTNVRSDIESLQFQLTFDIPKINVRAQYHSTGVLILIQASGSGDYWGEYKGVKSKVYFKAVPKETVDGYTYLVIESIKMDFSVKEIRMGVENIKNANSVIQAAMNLFINSNSQELLKEMKPTLKTKLTTVMHNFIDRLFQKIPLELWLE